VKKIIFPIKNITIRSIFSPILGALLVLFSLALSLGAYYSHHEILNLLSFAVLLSALCILYVTVVLDLTRHNNHHVLSLLSSLLIPLVYFGLRIILHRFDFSVGDPSDYYLAGVCSITYDQDIGYFLPLTASLSAVGFSVFGLQFAPVINIVFQFAAPLVLYLLLRRFGYSTLVSVIGALLYIVLPLSIWFASTSFSDPIWQLFLMLFILFWIDIIRSTKFPYTTWVALLLLLFLSPFLRGESVLLYGLMAALTLYYVWLKQHLSDVLLLLVGLALLTIAISLTLDIRSNYLIHAQFSRVIPDITVDGLKKILYLFSAIIAFVVIGAYYARNLFKRIPLPAIYVTLALVFKFASIYYYTQTHHLSFLDYLIVHEYGFATGNFGHLLSLMIFAGIAYLYYKAFRGNVPSLVIILVYTLFHIPFMMQKVSFFDPHAMLFYWNRYYLSMMLFVHIIALLSIFQLLLDYLSQRFSAKRTLVLSSMSVLLFSIFLLSVPSSLYRIVLTEPHQAGSYKLVPWLKKHVGKKYVSVVYDASMIYRQNKGHIGLYDIKHLISRVLVVFKFNAKDYESVPPSKLNHAFMPKANLLKRDYLLCVSQKPCNLNHRYFHLIDTLHLPLRWREHFTLPGHHIATSGENLSDSYLNDWDLRFELYQITPEAKKVYVEKQKSQRKKILKEISFTNHSKESEKYLQKGWKGIVGQNGALSYAPTMSLLLTNIPISGINIRPKTMILNLQVLTASRSNPVKMRFRINKKLVRQSIFTSSHPQKISLSLPTHSRTILLEINNIPTKSIKKNNLATVLKSIQFSP